MPKITKEEFDFLYSDDITKKNYDKIIQKINGRFLEVCKKFVNPTGDYSWYDYGNCHVGDNQYEGDYSDGFFDPEKYKERIEIDGINIKAPEGYSTYGEVEFPTRWLCEDFEEEMKKTIEAAIKKEVSDKEHKKNQIKERKARYAALQEIIKSKLTAEELKAIKFK